MVVLGVVRMEEAWRLDYARARNRTRNESLPGEITEDDR